MAKRLTKAEILAQIPAARERAERSRAEGMVATSVVYDLKRKRFMLELSNGSAIAVPVTKLPELASAKPRQLQAVTLSPSGAAIRVSELDADFSVAGVVQAVVGAQFLKKAAASIAGQATSEAKSAAARANGALGGRPRKTARVVAKRKAPGRAG